MRSSGNGLPQVCVYNLLSTIRGEIPYERIKGLPAEIIDTPASNISELSEEIEYVLETYEPRVSINSVDDIANSMISGCFDVNIDVTINDNVDEEIVDYD